METLIQIVANLRQPELRMLKSYYRVRQNKEPSKKLELLNLITGKRNIDDKAAMKKLYKNSDGALSAYSHLKERLKTDLLNSMLFVHPEKIYSVLFAKKKLECRKLIIQAELLLNRGNFEISGQLLHKVISIAQKFEYPYLEIQARDILRAERALKDGYDNFDEHNRRIEECFQLQKSILKAKGNYWGGILANSKATNKVNNKISLEILADMERMIKETGSVRIKFWYYLSAVYYYMSINSDYDKVICLQKEFIQLIEKEVALRSKASIAGSNMQLANVYIIVRKYKEGLPFALKALQFFQKDSFNYLRALEMLFWIYLRVGNHLEAENTIRQAFQHPNINQSPYFKAKWSYLKANVLFLRGDYSSAHSYLLESDELTKDKTGWFVGFKLLMIYISFEQKNLYWLGSQLENFRKLINRNKSANLNRAKTIHKISYALLQAGGDFKKVGKTNNQDLMKLKEAKDKMYWDPMGYEIVKFDDWFHKKV